MGICPRCYRAHSGVCGIPGIGVRIGIGGTGIGGARTSSRQSDVYPLHSEAKAKPKKRKLTKHGLEEMLDWGMEQEQKCRGMLKVLPPELPEYQQLLEKLEQVIAVNEQVRRQLAARRT